MVFPLVKVEPKSKDVYEASRGKIILSNHIETIPDTRNQTRVLNFIKSFFIK